ncbi:MAG: peptidylprolyl isomerase [Thermoanaerobaculia bacterium]
MKRDILLAIALILIVSGVCFGLATLRPDRPPVPSHPFTETTGNAPAANEKIVMRVNGEPVTEREFNAIVRQSPEEMRSMYATDAGRRALADQLVKLKALEQEGRKLGAADDPEVRTQLSLDHANLLANYALRKIIGNATDAEIQAEYAKSRTSLQAASLSHILLAYRGGAIPPRSGEALPGPEVLAKAKALVKELRKGADFAAMARAQSDDTESAARGGVLGPFTPDQLPPELATAVVKLKPGDVSDPVVTRFGVHILRVSSPEPQPLSVVKGALQQKVQQEKMNAALSRLSKSAKVDLDPVFFNTGAKSPGAARRKPG